MSELTNRERLEEAGIIGPELTQEQYDAIDRLTEEEVDQLIDVNDKLQIENSNTDPIAVLPGINPNQNKQGS